MITITILAISWEHILVMALILVLLFGGKKIPELMRGMGSGIKEFKDAVKKEDQVQPSNQNPAPQQPVNNPVNTPNNSTGNSGN